MCPLIIVIIFALLLWPGAPMGADDSRRSLSHDGLERSFLLHVPARLPPEPAPLVLVLHGGGGDAARVVRFSRFREMAERAGFIVAFPEAVEGRWNDGRTAFQAADGDAADDVGFLLRLVETLAEEWPVDRRRVYVVGPSNGGMMTLRLACEAAGSFAAFAVLIANQPLELAENCRPARPLPILIMNGTADPLMPWEGGAVGLGWRDRGRVLSTEQTVGLWRRLNGCGSDVETARIHDLVPDNDVTVTARRWPQCGGGGEVTLYTLENGGHRWPGRPATGRPLLERVLGPAVPDFDGTAEVWAFFRRHRLP